MIKEIQYAGFATEPSDYECPDGQLDTSINLICEEGQLKPIFYPATTMTLPDGCRIVITHKTAAFTHYIILDSTGNTIKWLDAEWVETNRPVTAGEAASELAKKKHTVCQLSGATFISMEAMGNTLILLTEDSTNFFLWKKDAYISLGQKPKPVSVEYRIARLATQQVRREFFLRASAVGNLARGSLSADDIRTYNADTILASFGKCRELGKKSAVFWFPFFVRCAYRTFSGSHIMHTAPFLVVPNALGQPIINLHFSDSGNSASCEMPAVKVNLTLTPTPEEWRDVITGIDIFITPQQQGFTEDAQGTSSFYLPWTSAKDTLNCGWITEDGLESWADKVTGGSDHYVTLSRTDGKTMQELVEEENRFFLYKTILNKDFGEAASIDVPLELRYEEYDSLTSRETLDDDYHSRDHIIAASSYVFNNRLNLVPEATRLTVPDFVENFVPVGEHDGDSPGADTIVGIQAEITDDSGTYYTDIATHGDAYTAGTQERCALSNLYFVFYPHPKATALILKVRTTGVGEGDYSYTYAYLPLKPHTGFNGAYAFENFSPLNTLMRAIQEPLPNDRIAVSGKIYTSEVNNPFFFPLRGINTVGTGTILSIRSAVKALSQGQFGQFPLYAFTTEGVWALDVSDTGTYSARQPVTRDVCISPDSITQTDDAVLFATARGIMLIKGSQTKCITDTIFSGAPSNVLDLPGIDQLLSKLGHTAEACLPVKPFLSFLDGCRMVYDYVHQHIVVFNPTKENGTPLFTYAYVFSLKSKMWGMMLSDFSSPINAYPDALAMTHEGKLVSFSDTDEDVCKGLYITRPLKLEAANIHKTISALIQRGHFQRGDVGTVLYGSRDLYTWYLVWSSKDHYLRGFRGTPYKYFRIAGLASLTDGKSIFGASVNFEPRHTNNLR